MKLEELELDKLYYFQNPHTQYGSGELIMLLEYRIGDNEYSIYRVLRIVAGEKKSVVGDFKINLFIVNNILEATKKQRVDAIDRIFRYPMYYYEA